MSTLGQNTVSGKMLKGFVESVEALRQQKKDLAEDEKLVLQQASSAGFSKARIRDLVRLRAMKPHDLAEAEAQLDMYRHAIGMANEPPLLRAMAMTPEDALVRETIIEKMKMFVPPHGLGEITVSMGGKPVRLSRDKDGNVVVVSVEKEAPRAPAPGPAPRPARAPAPDVDGDGAEAMGRQYARDNRPVIENPFPFGDARRPRFDRGWRAEAGSDGMGPEEDES